MAGISQVLLSLAVVTLAFGAAPAQRRSKAVEIVPPAAYAAPKIENSQELQTILNEVIGEVLNAYPDRSFKTEEIAATLIDLRDPNDLRWASFNGERQIYPASVVKMFYMAAL